VTSKPFVADPGSITELHRAIKDRRTDPCAILDARLRRIADVEPRVHGFRLQDAAGAMAQAQTLADEAAAGRLRGPLHGIPVAIKDVIDVAGWPTRAGSSTRANAAASTIDATLVTQLRAAGAVIVGKAHTTEFAYFDGPPPTRNPHNLAHTPGGSSGGPAAVGRGRHGDIEPGDADRRVDQPGRRPIAGSRRSSRGTRSWPSFGVVPFSPHVRYGRRLRLPRRRCDRGGARADAAVSARRDGSARPRGCAGCSHRSTIRCSRPLPPQVAASVKGRRGQAQRGGPARGAARIPGCVRRYPRVAQDL